MPQILPPHHALESKSLLSMRVTGLFAALILAIGCTLDNSEFASIRSIDSRVINGSLTQEAYLEIPPDLSRIYAPEGTRVRHVAMDRGDIRQARVLIKKTVANMGHPTKFNAKDEFGTLGIEYCSLPQAIIFREYGTRDGRPDIPIWFTIDICIEVPESVQVHHTNLARTDVVFGQDSVAWRRAYWENIPQRNYEDFSSSCDSTVVHIPPENSIR